MPSITDKLKKLGVQVGTSNIKPVQKSFSPAALVDALEGTWESTSMGDCFVVRKIFPLNLKHGARTLGQLPNLDFLEAINSLAGVSRIPLDQFMFIDTETTGLSGGAGTYVFLVGAAKIEEDGIHFAQFFLQDPSTEPCQLAALEDYTTNTKVIVSYNGKSFDLPRIKNRYLFHGLPSPFQNVIHIDLLHLARRLWKAHLPSCSLGDIEYHLLGLERSAHDIPGWQVSEKFFEYLQSGNPSPLEGVFYHNEVDVISLITLLGYISDRLSDPLAKEYRENHDLISIAGYLSDLGRSALALEVFSSGLKIKALPDELSVTGLTSSASIHKRMGNTDLAVPFWEKSASYDDIDSKIELAMYYEHKIMDFEEAIHWTLSALSSIESSNDLKARHKKELDHRLARLKDKLKSRGKTS